MTGLSASNQMQINNIDEIERRIDITTDPMIDSSIKLAAYICQTPVALINFVGGKQRIVRYRKSFDSGDKEDNCSYVDRAEEQPKLFVIEDGKTDKRGGEKDLIWEDPRVNFYADANLVTQAGQILGTLCVVDYIPRELNLDQQHFLEALSRQVVKHLELKAKLNNLEQVVKEQEKLQSIRSSNNAGISRSHLLTLGAEVANTLSKGGTLPELLKICTETIAHYLETNNVGIWTFDKQVNTLKLTAFTGQDVYSYSLPKRLLCEEKDLEKIKYKLLPEGLGTSPANCRYYTLIVEERTVGIMVIFGSQSFSEEEDIILRWVANNIGLAIERILTREVVQNRRETLLLNLGSQLRNSLDFNGILETAVQEVRKLLQIDRCHFFWCFPHPFNPRVTVSHEVQNPNLPSLLGDFAAGKVNFLLNKIRNLEIIRIDDLAKESELNLPMVEMLSNLGITSQLIIPLKTHSGQYGAIVCSHCNGTRPWKDSEVELLQAVCDRVAIAIDQAEFYAQTRASAIASQNQAQQLSSALYKLQQAQTQLVQHEKMSSLGQLVAGVAHEINNPVNFINGNLVHAIDYIQDLLAIVNLYQQYYPNPVPEIQTKVEEVELEFLAEDLPKLLSSMQMGADRIRQIVLSLRNFSRHDESEMKRVNIHEGIDNTVLILESRLKANGGIPGIVLVKEYGDLPLVECYPGQLNQVFMNVLSNAIDALENRPAPKFIKISTELIKGEKFVSNIEKISENILLNERMKIENCDRVLIRISDNGLGITEAAKSRLFDPFFTTKPVGKGTGLGLSISYQIVVEKHGGMLKCKSELGKGSEFLIEIPLRGARG